MTKREEMIAKICLVGDSAVGKTSLIKRYVFDEFDHTYLTTLGTKVTKREMVLHYSEQECEVDVKLLIFDIIGEKGFRRLLREAFFQGASGLMAVCDVTRGETLDSLEDWTRNAYEVTGKVPIHLMANKTDLKDDIAVSESEIIKASRVLESPYDFTSAKTGENVEKVFEFITQRMVDRAIAHRSGD